MKVFYTYINLTTLKYVHKLESDIINIFFIIYFFFFKYMSRYDKIKKKKMVQVNGKLLSLPLIHQRRCLPPGLMKHLCIIS